MIFYITWVLGALYSWWRIISQMAEEGEVDNGGRVLLFLSLFPGIGLVIAFLLFLVEVMFWIAKWIDKWWQSPALVTWRIERKIRKRRRGPIVTLVQYLHKRKLEKAHEKDVSEV